MVHPEIVSSWQKGELLSVADRGQYLLVEMPHNLFVDLGYVVAELREAGIRPILAHAERQRELLHEAGPIERLIRAGCLIQVNSGSVIDATDREEVRALKDWFKRGIVHLMGSDAHSPRRRRPRMAEAYRRVAGWAGSSVADRVFSTNATAVVHGLPLRIPEPAARRTGWLAWFR
jgi:protein-tyrosine phosphatase